MVRGEGEGAENTKQNERGENLEEENERTSESTVTHVEKSHMLLTPATDFYSK